MSDVWHKAGFHEAIDDKLKVSKDGKWVYWTMYGWNIPGEDAHDIGCEWCYLDDLLALETELIRTRKALDKAKWWLHEIVESHRCTPISTAEMALEDITALEKSELENLEMLVNNVFK